FRISLIRGQTEPGIIGSNPLSSWTKGPPSSVFNLMKVIRGSAILDLAYAMANTGIVGFGCPLTPSFCAHYSALSLEAPRLYTYLL
uniref:Uncharacterized protein n=1 Tax=Oncorhynchus mykiss TaxID=8022 RepID=A0A8C7SXT5_ONCMY